MHGSNRLPASSRLTAWAALAFNDTAVLAACVAVAALSLLAPSVPDYDPWGWLVWGREVLHLALDTTQGPSWKPLPVLFTTVFSLFGDAAPLLWMLFARATGLIGLALVFRLAARFAGPVAGLIAAAALLVTPDGESEWVRYMAQGELEPLLIALCLAAVERHLDGRHLQAFSLAVFAGLARPEIWPYLLLYVPVVARDRSARPTVGVLLALIPLLWFGGDWWGSGSAFTGGERARVLGEDVDPLLLALRNSAAAVIVPLWGTAAVAVVGALRRREPMLPLLAVSALGWMAIVTATAVLFGFAALPRFLAPAAALLCVLGGIGAVELVRAAAIPRTRVVAVAALVAVSVPFALPRIVAWRQQAIDALVHRAVQQDLDRVLAQAGGAAAITACPSLSTDPDYLTARPALAWKADLAMSRIDHRIGTGAGVTFELLGGPRTGRLAAGNDPGVQRLARAGYWGVYAIDCPAAATAA